MFDRRFIPLWQGREAIWLFTAASVAPLGLLWRWHGPWAAGIAYVGLTAAFLLGCLLGVTLREKENDADE